MTREIHDLPERFEGPLKRVVVSAASKLGLGPEWLSDHELVIIVAHSPSMKNRAWVQAYIEDASSPRNMASLHLNGPCC